MKIIVFIITLSTLTSAQAPAQNTAVLWGAFDQGFAVPASSRTSVKSVAGQAFIGFTQSASTRHDAGFLADTLLRGSLQVVPVYSFQQTFGYSGGYDQAYSVIQTRDSGYVLAGWTASFGSGRMYVVKANPRGVQVWNKVYPTPSYEQCLGIDETSDGGLILVGYQSIPFTSITDLFYVRTNSQGDTLWTRKIGNASGSQGTSVQQTPDGGFIILGFKPRPTFLDNDFYLLKTNANGDTLWAKTFNNGQDIGTSVVRTSDGSYVFVGYSQGGFSYITFIKTDSLGVQQWMRTIGPTSNNAARAYAVRQTIDGGYIIAGSDGPNDFASSAYLYKADADGNLVWQKRFRNALSWTAFDVRQTLDGGYILTGQIYNPGPQVSDVFLLKTNINGDSLWTKAFGGASDDVGRSVRQTFDGGFVIGGYTNSYGTGLYDMYLIKGDAQGVVTAVGGHEAQSLPEGFQLLQNYPNPFNPITTIRFGLALRGHVELNIYNILGQKVRTMLNDEMERGEHVVQWDSKNDAARSVASGVYFYRLTIGEFVQTRKMLLLK